MFGETELARPGESVIDRVHQCMILFAAGHAEALKRFLAEAKVGHDPRFWRLAPSLKLWPPHIRPIRLNEGKVVWKR